MCGIAVVHDLRPDLDRLRVARQIGEDMLARLHHRGPDGSGTRQVGPTWLGHTRLAIVDLDGGEQPLRSPDGNRWVVANGEIYNHDDLRSRLGGPFVTDSDSEVVLHVVDQLGRGRHPRHARDVRLLHRHPARRRRPRPRPAGDQAALLGQARRPGAGRLRAVGVPGRAATARRGVPAGPPLDSDRGAAGLRRPAFGPARRRGAVRRAHREPRARPSGPSGRPSCTVSANG